MADPTLKIANQVASTHPVINNRRINSIEFNGKKIVFTPPGTVSQIDFWPQANTTSSAEKHASATGSEDFPGPVSVVKNWTGYGFDEWNEFIKYYPTGNIYINQWAGSRGGTTNVRQENATFNTVDIWEAPDPVPATRGDLNEDATWYDPAKGNIVWQLSNTAWSQSGHGGWAKGYSAIMVYRRGTTIVFWVQAASRVWHNWSANYPMADSQARIRNLTLYRTTDKVLLQELKDKGIDVPETINIPVDLKVGDNNDKQD